MSDTESDNYFSQSEEGSDIEDDPIVDGPLTPEEFFELDPDEYEPPTRSRWFSVARVIIGLIFVFATVYLFGGVHEYLFFRETPTNVQAPEFESHLAEAQTLILPVEVVVLQSGERGSQRTHDNVEDLVAGADEIWDQASIDFTVTGIRTTEVSEELIAQFRDDPRLVLNELEQVTTDQVGGKIKIVLTRTLRGINGIAYSGLDVVSVADYTTYFDFRVLAHEIGHILSLPHANETGDRSRLMYQGSRGMIITEDEARQARESAQEKDFIQQDMDSSDPL